MLPISGIGDLVFLHEQRPVPPPGRDRSPEVPKVPGENQAAAVRGHRHHDRIDQIEPALYVPLDQVESATVFAVRRPVERVRPREQRPPEHDGCVGTPSGAQNEVHFDVHRPGNEDAATER